MLSKFAHKNRKHHDYNLRPSRKSQRYMYLLKQANYLIMQSLHWFKSNLKLNIEIIDISNSIYVNINIINTNKWTKCLICGNNINITLKGTIPDNTSNNFESILNYLVVGCWYHGGKYINEPINNCYVATLLILLFEYLSISANTFCILLDDMTIEQGKYKKCIYEQLNYKYVNKSNPEMIKHLTGKSINMTWKNRWNIMMKKIQNLKHNYIWKNNVTQLREPIQFVYKS